MNTTEPSGRKPVRRALLSVTDKGDLVPFARALSSHGIELVSTGGTSRVLKEAGLPVRDIDELTGFPEMLDGRVKTLHPRVHGGLLHIRSNSVHVAAIAEHGIEPIDMVVVNLYAFEKASAREGVAFSELIENIDIGGPSMLRSAAKNFEDVAVVTDPADYEGLIAELDAHGGQLGRATRWRLARKAFSTTAAYDVAIANALDRIGAARIGGGTPEADQGEPPFPDAPALPGSHAPSLPDTLRIVLPRTAALRYGENPHQRAALYADGSKRGIAGALQLQGKELSYNNLVDLDACWELTREFPAPASHRADEVPAMVAIIKHTNPCGAATGSTVLEAYQKALAADPISAFGGVIGINTAVDEAAAEEIAKLFVEAIVAPAYTPGARERFAAKKNLRLLEVEHAGGAQVIKHISGGLLVQDADRELPEELAAGLKTVSARPPSDEERRALLFAWRVAKHVKSNAIVYARDGQTVGIGAGQMSRVDAARFGAQKAALPLAGTVAASDAFFPFPDGLEVVADTGATAVIQPGGSVRDPEVIAAADRRGLAMIFTGVRHFRH